MQDSGTVVPAACPPWETSAASTQQAICYLSTLSFAVARRALSCSFAEEQAYSQQTQAERECSHDASE
eukprot:1691612-Pleurochrysis_carterae.AAC.4